MAFTRHAQMATRFPDRDRLAAGREVENLFNRKDQLGENEWRVL